MKLSVLLPAMTYQQSQMCFLYQSYLHSFDTYSGLFAKMSVICLQICSRGNGLLCLYQNIKIQTFISPLAAGGVSTKVKLLDSPTS